MKCPRCHNEIDYLVFNKINKIYGIYDIEQKKSLERLTKSLATYYVCPQCQQIVVKSDDELDTLICSLSTGRIKEIDVLG
ncbi:MAG: hypothetical protein KKH94_10730 [Candidatus Omnitrophica bacterium]|nr:hypothetical protein [Candidatus Omnitrophota bacterium]